MMSKKTDLLPDQFDTHHTLKGQKDRETDSQGTQRRRDRGTKVQCYLLINALHHSQVGVVTYSPEILLWKISVVNTHAARMLSVQALML